MDRHRWIPPSEKVTPYIDVSRKRAFLGLYEARSNVVCKQSHPNGHGNDPIHPAHRDIEQEKERKVGWGRGTAREREKENRVRPKATLGGNLHEGTVSCHPMIRSESPTPPYSPYVGIGPHKDGWRGVDCNCCRMEYTRSEFTPLSETQDGQDVSPGNILAWTPE